MTFYIQNDKKLLPDLKIKNILSLARERVAYYKINIDELNIDQYLKNNINKGLKETCLDIVWNKAIVNYSAVDNEFVITFKDELSNKVAQLITYGNSELFGSPILKFAFDQQY